MERISGTLEQWRMAITVADAGGFARAAHQLNKSQSAVSHGVAELAQRLGTPIFQVIGREARLTAGGSVLLRRARRLLEDARQLEQVAQTIAQGMETSLTMAADAIVSVQMLMTVLQKFSQTAPQTRVEVHEVVLSGILEAMEEGVPGGSGGAVLGLSAIVPEGFLATPLYPVDFIGVAHRDHPLHQLGRPLDDEDLRRHRHLVIADSGQRRQDAGFRHAEQRWTFSNYASSLEALKSGHGFCWLPTSRIQKELDDGSLIPLNMRQPVRRRTVINLIHRDRETLGPAANILIDLFRAEQHPGVEEMVADVIRIG
jgi:DNA-binding transcriptional LysR family regulator